jgi:predicted ribosome quality control (RQC) complex YloA/Tae2 family protein
MKQYQLIAITKHLKSFDYLNKVRRVADNVIEVSFNKDQSYFFDMTRGHSFIYKKGSQRPLKGYQAPFDNLLFSLANNSKVLDIEIINKDRVLRFKLASKSSYKDKIVYLQFEFTGKNTNAIILDDNGVIIEALRHIDADSSFRVIRPGVELLDIPQNPREYEIKDLENVDKFLEDLYTDFINNRLNSLKKQKVLTLTKKIKKLQIQLDKLPNEEKLKEEYNQNREYANIILANLYQIKPYDKKLESYDFDGDPITIKFPKNIVVNRLSEYFFNLSKRAKNRSKKIYIEKNNLNSKILFYENIKETIKNAKDIRAIEILSPKRASSQKKKEKLKECELFWIEDYKILVGRNSNENQQLLKLAKANDMWMHIRDVPSSHVIIKTDKQNLPIHIIESAAKLCVDFSIKASGDYKVDYTKRKFVKLQDGSNVFYDKYSTISVTKEGVEIRE